MVPPDEPSPASFKLAESLVILEFVIDLFPEANLLPRDPVERASTRFLVNLFAEKLRTAYINVLVNRASPQEVITVIEELQKYIPTPGDKKGPYINGNTFTSIDAVAAAFLIRLDGCLKRDIGSFPEGEGIKAYNVLHTSDSYEKYRAYLTTLLQRESVSRTFPEVYCQRTFNTSGTATDTLIFSGGNRCSATYGLPAFPCTRLRNDIVRCHLVRKIYAAFK